MYPALSLLLEVGPHIDSSPLLSSSRCDAATCSAGVCCGMRVWTPRACRTSTGHSCGARSAQLPTRHAGSCAGSYTRFLNLQVAVLLALQLTLCAVCAAIAWWWRKHHGDHRFHLATTDYNQVSAHRQTSSWWIWTDFMRKAEVDGVAYERMRCPPSRVTQLFPPLFESEDHDMCQAAWISHAIMLLRCLPRRGYPGCLFNQCVTPVCGD